MVKISIEDVVFWLIILFIIGIALWMLHGSPMDSNAIIAIALAFTSSELLIWRTIFNMDKRTTIGFMKIKNDMDKNNLIMNNKLDNRFNTIENKLNILTNRRK